jgi:hypothetical protein
MENEDLDFGDLDFGLDERKEVLKKGGAQAGKQISEVLKKFKTRKADEKKLYWDNVDSEYWIAVCFQSREQKDRFLEAMEWDRIGDKYLDGIEVMRAMKIPVGEVPAVRKVQKHKTWEEFVKTDKTNKKT